MPQENNTLNNYTWEKQQNKWQKIKIKNRNNNGSSNNSNNQTQDLREHIPKYIDDVNNNQELLSYPLNRSKIGGKQKNIVIKATRKRKI